VVSVFGVKAKLLEVVAKLLEVVWKYLWIHWMLAWATAVPGGASHPGRVDLLVSSSNSRIPEAAQRYREARSEALLDGDSQARGREVTAGADLMLACEAAGYR
jgi:hypothetical protein